MLLTEHKKANMISYAIMADVKNGNQHLHFSDNLKYSENLGMRTYWRLFKEVSQLNHMGGSPGDVSENPVTLEKWKKGWRMSCDVGEATEVLENELWRR